jgi:Flp pilus assembly protein TadG
MPATKAPPGGPRIPVLRTEARSSWTGAVRAFPGRKAMSRRSRAQRVKHLALTVSDPRRRSLSQGGQELVEYALVFPMLMLLVLGIIEFGIIIFSYNTIANAAREGARYGILHETDLAGIETVARDRALGLDQTALQVTPTSSGGTMQVEVIYEAHLLTAPIIEAFGGDLTVPLRAVSTMRLE